MPQKSGKSQSRAKSSKPSRPFGTTQSVISFPPAWTWLVDEAIPEWVKKTYSPQESWKSKPFSKEDSHFFFKGVEELSELFTEERPTKLPSYFAHPKFRSGYLLYFLPLQAAKFLTLFQLHSRAMEAALQHGRKTGKLVIADLGAGPATASLATLMWLLGEQAKNRQELPFIEFHWLDTNRLILEDGKALVERVVNDFPKLRGKVSFHLHIAPWWEAGRLLPEETSLLFMGNILNEAHLPSTVHSRPEGSQLFWSQLLKRVNGGGILFVEPAARRSSQLLSQLRDQLIEEKLMEASPLSIWGPCLHAGACPLAQGRDWCHFSVPVQIPGSWFKSFSKALGSERQWAKFSYLWLTSPAYPSSIPAADLRRVISDPLRKERFPGAPATVLICEPETPTRMQFSDARTPWRGDIISLNDTLQVVKPASAGGPRARD